MDNGNGTVLLICSDEQKSIRLMNQLFHDGFSVVGPATRASVALALAAQTAPSVAIVADRPNGRRGAAELGQALMENWGIRSLVLPGLSLNKAQGDRAWMVGAGQLERFKNVLEMKSTCEQPT